MLKPIVLSQPSNPEAAKILMAGEYNLAILPHADWRKDKLIRWCHLMCVEDTLADELLYLVHAFRNDGGYSPEPEEEFAKRPSFRVLQITQSARGILLQLCYLWDSGKIDLDLDQTCIGELNRKLVVPVDIWEDARHLLNTNTAAAVILPSNTASATYDVIFARRCLLRQKLRGLPDRVVTEFVRSEFEGIAVNLSLFELYVEIENTPKYQFGK